jgi:transcriptional regulator with XRE-family HTH domain
MGQYRITWGRNITDRRNRAGLARNEFAAALGVSIQTVSRWESGKLGVADDDKFAICALLGEADGRTIFPIEVSTPYFNPESAS